MLTTIKETITPEAYLSAERKSETKNEFINGKIIPMSGASLPHNIIASSLARLLGNQLENKDYIVCQSDMRVHNPLTQSYFYPDVVVIEGEAQLVDNEFDNLLNPVLIVEVLSPGTTGYDRGDKALYYRHIPTLKEYLVVAQEEALVEHWVKISENKWQLEEMAGLEKTIIVLDGMCRLPLSEVYRKVKLKN
jgi:Uma2 family endonuclease